MMLNVVGKVFAGVGFVLCFLGTAGNLVGVIPNEQYADYLFNTGFVIATIGVLALIATLRAKNR